MHIPVDDEDDEYAEDDEVDEEHGDETTNVAVETPTTESIEQFGEPHTHVDEDGDENEVEDPSLKVEDASMSEEV